MALKATIFKAELQIADMDRGYYGNHAVTVARHPSETDERMMVRLLAFALHASDALTFGSGLSAEEEPELWRKDLTGGIDCWIDVGLPDEKRLRKACGRANEVFVYAYGGRATDMWWKQVGELLAKQDKLTVNALPHEATKALAAMAARNMTLQFSIQEQQALVTDGQTSVQIELHSLQAAKPRR
jgi:uncharacterized protein YaeQ